MKTIDFKTLFDMRINQDNYVLIDVRSFDQFDQKHITDADNIPLDEATFTDLVEKRVVSKEAKIIVYCGGETCPLSEKAAQKLEQAGFTNVLVYKGGVKDWYAHEKELSAHHAAA